MDVLLNKYKYDTGSNTRQSSLDQAIIEYGAKCLVKKLQSICENTKPDKKKIIEGDISWLQNRYKIHF
jgi:hypothetical protein